MKRLITSTTASIFGMAKIDKDDFNLPYDIWLDPAGSSRRVAHKSPRLKVDVNHQQIPFSISDAPQPLVHRKILDESKICEFIVKNKDNLLKHWNLEISDKDILNRLESL